MTRAEFYELMCKVRAELPQDSTVARLCLLEMREAFCKLQDEYEDAEEQLERRAG